MTNNISLANLDEHQADAEATPDLSGAAASNFDMFLLILPSNESFGRKTKLGPSMSTKMLCNNQSYFIMNAMWLNWVKTVEDQRENPI